jgi:hypothetical protein
MHVSISNEQGSAKILTVSILLILAVVVYAGVQLFPLYWDHWNFEEAVRTTMIATLVPPYKDVDSKVKQAIMTLLDNMGAQYEKEYVKVEVSSNHKTIHVQVWYARSHHLPLYPNPKRFYLNSDYTSLLPKSIELPTRPPLQGIE